MEAIRSVLKSVRGRDTTDGAGVRLKRIIAQGALPMLDPFLLLDEFRSDDPEDYIAGFPDHPHRGFETVTYLVAGSFRHKDSRGHEGRLGPGSVQWMRAGRGVIHSEMPMQENGLSWGFQLWLNLPSRLKMSEPAYQDITPDRIPRVTGKGADVKVISGAYGGETGPGKTALPFTYLDVQLERGAHFRHGTGKGDNCFLYCSEGSIETGAPGATQRLMAGSLAVMGEGGTVEAVGGGEGGRFLLCAAPPLNEPVARGGPFVMNTEEEVLQAFEDYRAGRLG